VPLAHSPPAAQIAPVGLSPHDPALQVAGGAQSASDAQVELQAPTPQANGKQDVAEGVTHIPAPSHTASGVRVVPLAGQLAPLHEVPWPYFWQVPASHLPVVPQVAFP
jgi:hypothetical protein